MEQQIELHQYLVPVVNAVQKLRRGDDENEAEAEFKAAVETAKQVVDEHRTDWRDIFQREIDQWFSDADRLWGWVKTTPRRMREVHRAKDTLLSRNIGRLAHGANTWGLKEGGDE